MAFKLRKLGYLGPFVLIPFVLVPFFIFKLTSGFEGLANFGVHHIVFPLGLSFYTFQIVGYLLDVYRERIEPIRSFSKFFLFTTFFPQLVAGPIERAENILPQIEDLKLGPQDFEIGFLYLLQGILKKFLIANAIFVIVVPIFSNPSNFNVLTLLLGIYLARLFIFYDFSGYTDMAMGSARLFGVKLTNNFNRPFQARSLSEFWRRWHITLSSWIRDYIYFPMILTPLAKLGLGATVILTFLLLGMWHDFTLNFVAYGLCQGIIIVMSLYTQNLRKKISSFFRLEGTKFLEVYQKLFTFFISVGLPTVFFASSSFKDSLYIYASLIGLSEITPNTLGIFDITELESLIKIFCFVVVFEIYQSRYYDLEDLLGSLKRSLFLRVSFYIVMLSVIFYYGTYIEGAKFLYYAF